MTFERTKIIKGHFYRYLVKSVRVDGKVKQVSVKYLGKVPDVETADPLEVPEKNIPYRGNIFFLQESENVAGGGNEQARSDTKPS